jgi:16S rRNA G527 N7-methylase RsmG
MKEGQRYDYCLVRALGAADYILENCLFLLNSGGELFMYKGPKHEEELKALPSGLRKKISASEVLEVQVPFLDKKRFIVRMTKA